jgi:protein SCO1
MKFKSFIMLTFLILILSGCGGTKDKISTVQDFSFINQDNGKVSLSGLMGKVWIADFIFTNCETVCPPMTANMAKLQEKLNELDSDVSIVSFSVDPENDDSAALKEFGNKFGVDFSNWHFLSGYSQEEIQEFAKTSFKALVQDAPQSNQVVHGTSFYLINKEGDVVKSYSGVSNVPYQEIINDIQKLD